MQINFNYWLVEANCKITTRSLLTMKWQRGCGGLFESTTHNRETDIGSNHSKHTMHSEQVLYFLDVAFSFDLDYFRLYICLRLHTVLLFQFIKDHNQRPCLFQCCGHATRVLLTKSDLEASLTLVYYQLNAL